MAVDLAHVGRALAAPARSAMLDLLLDGSTRPAGELAQVAGVGASAGSEHLRVLLDCGLVEVEAHGRQRRYRLAGDDVATALESLGRLCPPVEVRSLRLSREQRDLRRARLCYDHLAGELGVALADAFTSRGWLVGADLAVSDDGRTALGEAGVPVAALTALRRPLSRACVDWTERRPHLAGSLGAAVAELVLDRGWVRRRPGSARGLDVTEAGERALRESWGVRVA